ncbi:polysaccharide biosynthesis/export family protein [Pseudoprimorskyibacter insulae]|nr:polysaccharide biosynthesis/export family protein [Pseudoprimorskyibacter insulae]
MSFDFAFRRILGFLAVVLLVSACSLPRGAALQSEILKEADKDLPTFQVVAVTRATVPHLNDWPLTGWAGQRGWLNRKAGASTPIIQSGDMVDLVIWDSQENSLLTQSNQKVIDMKGLIVSDQGTIFVPYVDEVHIRGLTASTARQTIQEKLQPVVPSAQVQLSAQPGIINSVDLVSGVNKPGTYPLPNRNYSILSLISQGGGISNSLRNPQVRLIRGDKTYEIAASDLLASATKNTTLRGGDKVVVEEDERSFTALGASGIENLIYFPKTHLTALESLSLMGGLSDFRADPKGVLILREYSSKQLRGDLKGPNMTQVVFTLDLTTADGLFAARKFHINPGDTVLATESPVTKAQTIFRLIGSAIGVSAQVQNLAN